jgi:hypothetical protein
LRTKWEGQVHGPIVRHQSLLFLRRLLVGSRPAPPDDRLWSGSHGDGGHRIRWSDGKGQVHDPVGRRSQVSGRLLVRPISSFLWPERYLFWRQHGPCSWWLRRPTAANHLRVRIHAASRPGLRLARRSASPAGSVRRSAERLHAWRRSHGMVWSCRRLGRIHVDIVGLWHSRPWPEIRAPQGWRRLRSRRSLIGRLRVRLKRLWWRPWTVVQLIRPIFFFHRRIWPRRQAVVLQVLGMKFSHTFLLPVQILPGPFGDAERLLQDVVAELRPHVASGRVALWSVRKYRLHFLIRQDFPRARRSWLPGWSPSPEAP